MTPIDIIFTPLDSPPMPEVDIPLLRSWMSDAIKTQVYENRADAYARVDPLLYPWLPVYAKIQKEWYNQFDQIFPELASYFHQAFKVNEEDVLDVNLLPLKDDKEGVHFWHGDPDLNGLRFYIYNKQPEDFLYMAQTKLPIMSQAEIGLPRNPKKEDFQSKILKPKLPFENQPFYLNNIRSIHAVNSKMKNSGRISVTVALDRKMNLITNLENLVVNSAKKFSEYAILWSNDASN